LNQTKVLNLQFKEEGKQNSKHTQDLLDDDKRYVLSGCFKEGIFGGKHDKTTTAAISI
jgi:hypothetical protein